MKRLLIDRKKLDQKAAAKLINTYPHGYGDDDIITLQKPNGEIIEAVEVKTDNAIYLVKIGKSFSNFTSNFKDSFGKELTKDPITPDKKQPSNGDRYIPKGMITFEC